MNCLCDSTASVLEGRSAKDFAYTELTRLGSTSSGWVVVYRCPRCGAYWVLDWPLSGMQGGGPARLRRIEEEEVGRLGELYPF